MSNSRSRLKETDFSRINLRDVYITSYPEYAAALRDEALFSNYGIKATIKVPKIENNVDEYSNFVDDDFITTVESVVPKFEQYRQNVSEEGMAADGIQGLYPLEVLIPTKLHLPKNSRIILTEYNSKEEIIAREWVVLSTEMKQLSGSKTYTRVANCVPARQTIHRTSEFENSFGTFYFDLDTVALEIHKNIRAKTVFYFNVYPVSLEKGATYEEIQEDVYEEYNPITQNLILDEDWLVVYDANGNVIIDAGIDNKDIQEVINNDEQQEWQESLTNERLTNAKFLKVKSENIASFVVKSTAISVLY